MTLSADRVDTPQRKSAGGGLAQVVIDSLAGCIVISAEGLAPSVEDIVRNTLTHCDNLASSDQVAGELLAAIVADERFSATLTLGNQPHYSSSWSVWLRYSYPDSWTISSGPDPARLTDRYTLGSSTKAS